jgi:TolB-like protein/Flp pilus assembly protein TadD
VPDASLLQRLRERKLVQWLLAYLAGAWLAVQVLDIIGERFNWPNQLLQGLIVLLGFGFLVALIFAWYHGEKGKQRFSGSELALLAAVFFLAAITIPRFATGPGPENPLEALVRIPDAQAAPVPRTSQPMVRGGPSVAVLPFASLSADPNDSYFADGIHEDVLNYLSEVDGLTLISRQSVLQYRDTELTAREIGQDLRVGAILEGTVRRQGDRIRVVTQLIDAVADLHLWSRTYDRELDDVFRVQSEIAREVAHALEASLTPEEVQRITSAPTGSVTAYDYYVRGREAHRDYTHERNEEAIRRFLQAIELDSAYAAAWAGLGDAYSMRRLRFGFAYEWTDSAIVASQRSVELDPSLADGHKALGLAYGTKGWYRRAIAAYLRAVELSPSHGVAMNNISAAYSALHVFDEALRWRRRSFQVSPNGPYSRSNAAIAYTNLGERELAERWVADAMVLNPDDLYAWDARAYVHLRWGELDRAVAIRDSIQALDSTNARRRVAAALYHMYNRDYPTALSLVGEAFELAPHGLLLAQKWGWTIAGFANLQQGDTVEADRLFQQSLTINQIDLDGGLDMPRTPWENASIFAALGRTDQALAWAEVAYRMGHRRYWDATHDPMFDSIREHPDFMSLLNRMREDVDQMRQQAEAEERAAGLR